MKKIANNQDRDGVASGKAQAHHWAILMPSNMANAVGGHSSHLRGEALSPLVRNRARNLMLAERYGLLLANNPTPGTEEWREMTLINGLMGLHADRIARLELRLARAVSMQARRDLRRVKKRRMLAIRIVTNVEILDCTGQTQSPYEERTAPVAGWKPYSI